MLRGIWIHELNKTVFNGSRYFFYLQILMPFFPKPFLQPGLFLFIYIFKGNMEVISKTITG